MTSVLKYHVVPSAAIPAKALKRTQVSSKLWAHSLPAGGPSPLSPARAAHSPRLSACPTSFSTLQVVQTLLEGKTGKLRVNKSKAGVRLFTTRCVGHSVPCAGQPSQPATPAVHDVFPPPVFLLAAAAPPRC